MKHVYFFGQGRAEGTAAMRDVLGGKGANLAEMTNLGIPVPPGFTIGAPVCMSYLQSGTLPEEVKQQLTAAMARLEEVTGKKFGGGDNPLLVSVRSGAKFSMPGMMDTILNLGLNDRTVEALARNTSNRRFAYDSYRRLIQMYGGVVFGIKGADAEGDPFDRALEELKRARGAERDIDLPAEDLERLVAEFKQIVLRHTGSPFPQDPWEQLWGAIEAVFRSWENRRAVEYRKLHRIPHDLGTAVNVVAMVYGNLGEDSGTGVAFTRNPSTGERGLFGEFLPNAQGEDVVAGIRDPEPIEKMGSRLPQAYQELLRVASTLERHFRDMQDIEFTVERGKLFLLQTRAGKRTVQAAVRIAVDLVGEGLIDRAEAVRRVDADQLDQLLHPMVDPRATAEVIATGLPASPGAAVGRVVLDADTAVRSAESGEAVVLVRRETSPDDFHGMVAAKAILTARGGLTSHAAVVARGMGKCCVVGAKDLELDEGARLFRANGRVVREGDWISVDGTTGRVFLGRVPLVDPEPGPEFLRLMEWADQLRLLRVRANADTPEDARRARQFGAEGIGLCRTEHMFFGEDRIMAMREMIVAQNAEGRRKALEKLLPMQRQDFLGIFREMNGFPVTIRLLDPPLHEFLPRGPEEIARLAGALGVGEEELTRTVERLAEANPMLGHRGCRLGITYPEITAMQARAIFEAACDAAEEGVEVHPEVMVPLVAHVEELQRQVEIVRSVAEEVFRQRGRRVEYSVGTMIELPRAALTAEQIAGAADFFSFGTNDLTQTTFGLSRDDAGSFLPHYLEAGILADDPFQTLDVEGVGRLIEMAVQSGRKSNPALKVGICGEHGGDPRSIAFCHRVGLNYVSCSPFRVPVARLAAAQAAVGTASGADK
ncbi:MAG: pyruvate, phosphate dikinase [Gemmatimonadales bacterium]|nr:MAG: pyruvate, phosphate dikinase [Gemmatimonadales bacterium]